MGTPNERTVMEQAANRCGFFRFGGCIAFVVDKEMNELGVSEHLALGNASTVCHAVVFPDCLAASYELYMKGQERLTKPLWDKIGWACRR